MKMNWNRNLAVVLGFLALSASVWADPKLTNVTATLLSTSPISAGTTGTFRIVTYKGTGAFNFHAVLSTTNSLPPGVTVIFNPGSLDYTGGTSLDRTGQMLVALSPSFATTNFNLCVTAHVDFQPGDVAGGCGTAISAVSTNPPSCSVSGPTNACPNATGLVYTESTDAAQPQFSWSVTGNGSIVGPTTNSSISVTAGAAGSFTAQCTVTDLANGKSNTCSRVCAVGDTTPPSITTCATNQLGVANGSCQATVPSFTNGVVASDSCSAVTISQSPAIGALVGSGTNTITISAADASGNTNTCTANFIVRDLTAPSITCPVDVNVNADAGQCVATGVNLGAPGVSDNCSTVTVSSNAPSSFPVGLTVVTWTAVDGAGNTNTCTQNVTVTDTQAPQITGSPTNITASADGTCQAAVPVFTNAVTATDNCGAVSLSQSPAIGSLVGPGTNTITVSVVDASGNTNTTTASYIVNDTTAPNITTCATNQIVNADGSGNALVPDFTSSVSASDPCGSVAITQSPTAGSTAGIGTNTITITVVDGSGNTNTCTASLVVIDNTPPNISTCASDASAEAGPGCTATVPSLTNDVSAADNSGNVTITQSPAAGSSADYGTNTITLIAADASGNSATCTASFVVNDTTAPNITSCPAAIDANTDNGLCTAAVALGTPVATDNCDIGSISSNAPAAFPVGSNTVVWTVFDTHGNSATCTQLVVVTDNQLPTLACPVDITTNLDLNACLISNVVLGAPGTTNDNCGVASVVNDAPIAFGPGATPVVWTVTDIHGNSATCTQTVTVTDVTPPDITSGPTNQTVTVDGNCEAPVPSFTNEVAVTTNCGKTYTVSQSPAIGSTVGLGDTTITVTVVDSAGNTNTATATLSAIDTLAPTIDNCPTNRTVEATAGGQAAVPDVTGEVGATDNCAGVLSVSQSPAASTSVGLGDNIVTLSVVDVAGNTNTCTMTLTVTDTTPPNIVTCAGNQSAEAGPGCAANVPDFTAGVSANDNSGDEPTITQSPTAGASAGYGTNAVTLIATDASGNSATCTASFVVSDTTAPSITTCAATINVDADADACVATGVSLGSVTASDNCGLGGTTNNAPASFPVGSNTVVWTVSDTYGNTATCTQLVIVTDTQLPTLACPDNIVTNLDLGACVISNVVLGVPASTNDNCGIAGVFNDAPVAFNAGSTEVLWTVVDIHGNSAVCTQTVVVTDLTPPDITSGPTNQTVAVDSNCEALVPSFTNEVVATTTCGKAYTVSQSPAIGSTTGLGDTTITITVVDDANNTNTATATLTVIDTTAPTIGTCPTNRTVEATSGGEAAVPDVTSEVSATDNCAGVLSITQSPTASTLVGLGNHTVTISVVDVAGNTNTCTLTLTVTDTTPPNISACAGNTQAEAVANAQAPVPNLTGSVTATDNGGPVTITQSPTAGTLVGLGDHTITFYVVDGSGNTNTCAATFTVVDTTNPTITACAGNSTANAVADCAAPVPDFTEGVTASDNGSSLTVVQSPLAGTSVGFGIHLVTLTVTDGSGNSTNCTATFTVTNTVAPTVTCPANITVDAAADETNAVVTFADPTASGPCGIVSLVVVPSSGSTFPIGVTVVTATAIDESGLTNSCTFTVTVNEVDDGEPVANPDSYDVAEDDYLDVGAPGVLSNDVNAATAVVVTQPEHGTLTLNANGSFTYIPDANYNGPDSFSYSAVSGSLTSAPVTVSINVLSVDGAGDVDLYVRRLNFRQVRSSNGRDRITIRGRVNPRGCRVDLTGGTFALELNGQPIGTLGHFDSYGNSSSTIGGVNVRARLKSHNGSYRVRVRGLNLQALLGLPNVNQTGNTPITARLTFGNTGLQIPQIGGTYTTPFTTVAGKYTTGRFRFKPDDTLTGVFYSLRTTALQDGNDFRVAFRGPYETEGSAPIVPTGPIRITIGNHVITIPGQFTVGRSEISVKKGEVPGLWRFSLSTVRRQFRLRTTTIPNTGIPLAGAPVTVHELPMLIEIPTATSTNMFETIIELKRSDAGQTHWAR